jgi:hypothetical protein
MRTALGLVPWVVGLLVAAAWTPAAQAQYVRTNIGYSSFGGRTSMTAQPIIVPSTARPVQRTTYDAADARNDASGAPGWGKDGFSWGRGHRGGSSDRYLSTSGRTSSLRAISPRDADHRSGRYSVR